LVKIFISLGGDLEQNPKEVTQVVYTIDRVQPLSTIQGAVASMGTTLGGNLERNAKEVTQVVYTTDRVQPPSSKKMKIESVTRSLFPATSCDQQLKSSTDKLSSKEYYGIIRIPDWANLAHLQGTTFSIGLFVSCAFSSTSDATHVLPSI
jgi:hypothetical protein